MLWNYLDLDKLEDIVCYNCSHKKPACMLCSALFLWLMGHFIIFSGAGFGAFFNIPSLLIFLPLLATIKLEDKLKGLLLRQNLLFGFVVVTFLVSMIGIFINSSASNVGSMLAIVFLTTIYSICFYLAWIKPQLAKIQYANNEFEIGFYVAVVTSIVVPFLTLLVLMMK